MASTTTTTYASTIRTKWLTELLKTATGRFVFDKFANTEVMGRGEGGTLIMNKILRPAKQTSAGTLGTLVAPASAKALTSNKIELTPQLFQDVFQFDDGVTFESFIKSSQNKDVIALQMKRSLEYQVSKLLAQNSMRHRIDKDASFQVSGTATSGTTTTVVNTGALAEANDYWNGGVVTIVNPDGANYDIAAKVADSVQASTNVVVAAQPQAYGSSSKYRLTVGTGLVATDVLTTSGIWDVLGLHMKLETEKFDDGYFRMFIDAAQYRDLVNDTLWSDSAKYDDSGRFKGYFVARWAGVELIVGTEIFREDADGTENQATGAVYCSPIIGKNAYNLVSWGGGGNGKFNVEWIITDGSDSQNLLKNASWIGWKSFWAGKVTRATSSIILMTGATSQNIVL